MLKEVASSIETKIVENSKKQEVKKKSVQSVKAGEKCIKQTFRKLLLNCKRLEDVGGLRIPVSVC